MKIFFKEYFFLVKIGKALKKKFYEKKLCFEKCFFNQRKIQIQINDS